jgi:hypothetical protein
MIALKTDLKQGVRIVPGAYSGENDHLFRMMPITQTG